MYRKWNGEFDEFLFAWPDRKGDVLAECWANWWFYIWVICLLSIRFSVCLLCIFYYKKRFQCQQNTATTNNFLYSLQSIGMPDSIKSPVERATVFCSPKCTLTYSVGLHWPIHFSLSNDNCEMNYWIYWAVLEIVYSHNGKGGSQYSQRFLVVLSSYTTKLYW